MNTKLTRRSAIAAGLAASAILPARAQVQGVNAGEIVLGTHLDLSGPVAAGMPALRFGMQYRIDEANAAGGINGRKLRLVVEDNGSQPQMAVRATNKLIQQDQVFAIVNPFGSGPNAAVVKRAVDAGILYFSPWGASSVLRQISGNSQLLFTTTPNYDTTVGKASAWAIENFKVTKVGFIYQEGPLGDLVRKGLVASLEAKGLKLLAEAGYKAGDIDFSSHVARMKAAGVELIVAATVTRETVAVMAETKKLGWNDVKVLTANPGRTVVVARLGGAAIEGLYGVGVWHAFSPANLPPAAASWFDGFRKAYNYEFDENQILAYAYTDWFLKALAAAGPSPTQQSVAEALGRTEASSPVFYGPKRFVGGHVSPEDVRVEQVKGGDWTPVSATLS